MAKLSLPVLGECKLHGVTLLTDEALMNDVGIRIAFTGRQGGVSKECFDSLNTAAHVGDNPADVERNRQLVLGAIGAQDAWLLVPNQVHGTKVVEVFGGGEVGLVQHEADEGADAVVVRRAGVAALLNFADCLPLVIASPSGSFAVVHAGWRGAVGGIAGKAARVLAREDAADVEGFNAYIGPHIGPECFEVGADVSAQFEHAFGAEALEPNGNVNLAAAVACDLLRAGMRPERIAQAHACTKCNPDRYFSYRGAGGSCGRQAAVAFRSR